MDLKEKLDRVDKDLKIGRIKRAIDRLHGFIFTYPNELIFRKKLGDIYYRINYLENAGRYWLLEEYKNSEMQKACDIYESSMKHNSQKILNDIKFRGELNNLQSEFARQKIKDLESQVLKNKQLKHNETQHSKIIKKLKLVSKTFIGILIFIILLASLITGFIVLYYSIVY